MADEANGTDDGRRMSPLTAFALLAAVGLGCGGAMFLGLFTMSFAAGFLKGYGAF